MAIDTPTQAPAEGGRHSTMSLGNEASSSNVLRSQGETRDSYHTNNNYSRSSMMPLPPIEAGSAISRMYVGFLEIRFVTYAVLALFCVATCVCIPWAIQLVGETELEWNAPSGSWAAEQERITQRHYPETEGTTMLVLVEYTDEDRQGNVVMEGGALDPPYVLQENPLVSYDTSGVRSFEQALMAKVFERACNTPISVSVALPPLAPPVCADSEASGIPPRVTKFSSYWSTMVFDPKAGTTFQSADLAKTYIMLTYHGKEFGFPDNLDEFTDWLKDETKTLSNGLLQPVGVKATLLSLEAGVSQIQDTISQDLALADGIAIPLSMIIAMVALRNVRLMIPPVLCIISVTFISMAILTGIAKSTSVPVIAVPIMISLVAGLPVGHCLFLLNRFREALLEGEEPRDAVQRMLSNAGTTIVLSQACLALFCLVITFIDVDTVQGLGYAMLVSVCVAFASAILLVPCVLLAFPKFFKAASKRTKAFGVRDRHTVALASRVEGRASQYGTTENRGSVVPKITDGLKDTVWHRFAQVTQSSVPQNWILVILIVCIIIPFAVVLFEHTTVTGSFEVYLPRRDTFTADVNRLNDAMGSGIAMPLTLVVLPPTGADPNLFTATNPAAPGSVWEQLTLGDTSLNSMLVNLPNFPISRGSAGFSMQGDAIDEEDAVKCFWEVALLGTRPLPTNMTKDGKWTCLWAGASVASFTKMPTDPAPGVPDLTFSAFSTSGSFPVQVDPLGPEGKDLISNFRDLQDDFNSRPNGPKVYLSGTPVNSYSIVDRVEDSWSWVLASFISIGFVVTLVGTRSILVAARLTLTTFFTACFSLGFTSMTYCHGALNWTTASALHEFVTTEGGEGGIHYLTLIVTVPLIVGLAICHELFFVNTALEWYHYHFLETKEAVKMALIGTGWMNILSGGVLAVSFMGLLFSRLPILNQIAFAMFWALLFDVLVIKTILMPITMAPFGKYNWWPATYRKGGYQGVDHLSSKAPPTPQEPVGFDVSMPQYKDQNTV